MRTKFGKTKVDVVVEGCYRCGTLWSSGWYHFKTLPVKIGDKTGEITLNICDDCATPEEKATNQGVLE